MPERRGYIQKDFWQLVLELQKTAELPALRKRQEIHAALQGKANVGTGPYPASALLLLSAPSPDIRGLTLKC